jgi:hypothetical protein
MVSVVGGSVTVMSPAGEFDVIVVEFPPWSSLTVDPSITTVPAILAIYINPFARLYTKLAEAHTRSPLYFINYY